MARTVAFTRAAAQDLERVRDWYSQPGAGERANAVVGRILDAIEDLKERPVSWPHGRRMYTRERPVEGHRIIYRVTPDTDDNRTAGNVQVLRIRRPYQRPL